MELSDSRRLTGPNLIWDFPGAVLEVHLAEDDDLDRVVQAWRAQAKRVLSGLGLPVNLTHREYPGGVSLAMAAPIDTLYTATEINEWAFESARLLLIGGDVSDWNSDRERFEGLLSDERDPRLLALAEAARKHRVNFCGDDEWTTLGMGKRGQTWDTPELPTVDEVNWERLADIPSAIITGTNGKTTTVRLLVAIVRAAGLTPGASSTDWIQVGDELVDQDDWSGPGGARAVLKDPRVEVALLETARGGLLRRGLAIPRADVAVITNVAADHLGEMGVHSLEDLTEVKFVVRRAGRHLVLNADNPEVRRRGQMVKNPCTWVSLDPGDELILEHLSNMGEAALLEGGDLVYRKGLEQEMLLPAAQVPITLDGAARYNITNALCAAAAAVKMGLSYDAIRRGLAGFESTPENNPGRLNEFQLGGVRALVDFAHNPHGMEAAMGLLEALPHERSVILLGQAGDRDDHSIEELARVTAQANPSLVIVKQMTEHLRGRSEGTVVGMIQNALRKHGMPGNRIVVATSELEAARQALNWSQRGDVLLLLCHAQRGAVLELLSRLQRDGWEPGEPLPE